MSKVRLGKPSGRWSIMVAVTVPIISIAFEECQLNVNYGVILKFKKIHI